MLEACKDELDAIYKITDPVEFLKHLAENYVSYKNEKVAFSEDDLKSGKI